MNQRVGLLALSSAFIAASPLAQLAIPNCAHADQLAMLSSGSSGLTITASSNKFKGTAGTNAVIGFNLSGAGAGGTYNISNASRDGDDADYTELGIPDLSGSMFQWSMSDAQPGKYKITFHAENAAHTKSGDLTVTVSIGASNHAPKLTTPPVKKVSAGGTVKIPLVGKDADGDALEYTILEGLPAGASLTGKKSNVFLWTTSAGDELGGDGSGMYTFTAGVRDSDGANWVTKSFKVKVSPAKPAKNASPKLKAPGSFDAHLGENLTFDACDMELATDDQFDCDALTFTAAVKKGGGQASFDGSVFTYVPQTVGTKILAMSVSDGSSTPKTKKFVVRVTDAGMAPTILMIGDQEVQGQKPVILNSDEGEPVFFNITATEGDTTDGANARTVSDLSYSVENSPEGSDVDAANGAFTWDSPTPGLYNLKVKATNAYNKTGSAKVKLRVRRMKSNVGPTPKAPPLRIKLDGYKRQYILGDAIDFAVSAAKPVDGVNYACEMDHVPAGATFTDCNFHLGETTAVTSEAFTVTLTPSDGSPAATRTFILNVVEGNTQEPVEKPVINHKPQFAPLTNGQKRVFRVSVGTLVRFQHSNYSDKDGDELELVRDGVEVTDEGNRTYSWVAVSGTYDVTFRAQEVANPDKQYDIQKFKFIVN